MARNKFTYVLFIGMLLFFGQGIAFAQAPHISYQTPQVYTAGTAITTLLPANTGGAVPSAAFGQVSQFAGNGSPASVDGTGTGASFNDPKPIAKDNEGNIYVGDVGTNMIRKITPAGLVTTVSLPGVTQQGIGGIAFDKADNMYVSYFQSNQIIKVTATGTISVFAGSGVGGSANGIGIQATLYSPRGMAFDKEGNLYVADYLTSTIRKITPTAVVSVFAGTGVQGSNNGPADQATFKFPLSVCVDADDNVFVTDAGNAVIRKITPARVVSTFAGGAPGVNIDGQGLAASFSDPNGITIDGSGNLYIADGFANLIRKITPTGYVSTIAGSGSSGAANGIGANATFNGVSALVYDGAGKLYVADSYNNLLRTIAITGYEIDKTLPPGLLFNPQTGGISGTPATSWPATTYTITAYNGSGKNSANINITVNETTAVLTKPNISYTTPNVYQVGNAIPLLIPTNSGGAVPANKYGQVVTIAGNNTPGSTDGMGNLASFALPVNVVGDKAGNLYVVDQDNYAIRKISPAGVVSTYAGSGSYGYINGSGTAAKFNALGGIDIDESGNLFVCDVLNYVIREIAPGGVVTTSAGTTNGFFNGPYSSAKFSLPYGIAIDAQGNKFIADLGNNVIREINRFGLVSTFAGTGTAGAADGTANTASFYKPFDLALDAAGNLYVADSYNNKIRKITPAGMVSTLAGSTASGFADGARGAARFNFPTGVVVDAAGNVYVGDSGNNRIRRIDASGNVTTAAGAGPGNVDGTFSQARFNGPAGLWIDKAGNLYVADEANNEIRKVSLTGYTIDKQLPPGLSFDPTTGIISGTPTAVSPATDYTVTAYNIGGSSSAIVNIKVEESEFILFPPVPEKTVCDVDFDAGATGMLPVTYTSSNTAVAVIMNGKVHITGAGSTDITAFAGTSEKKQTLTVDAALQPSVTIAGATTQNCAGDKVSYTATPLNGGAEPKLEWFVNGQNSGQTGTNFLSSNLVDNDQITCVLTSSAACVTQAVVTSDAVVFTVFTPPTAAVTITSSIASPFCAGTDVVFTATPSINDDTPIFQWQVNGIIEGTNSPVFSSTTLKDGDVVQCVLTSMLKCLVPSPVFSNMITITLSPVNTCMVIIPNTFTPNGDGINDLWNISALNLFPGCTVKIFTRYGSIVYNSINYPKPWDGTHNGSALPTGTYYYVIDLKDHKKPLSGAVTVVR